MCVSIPRHVNPSKVGITRTESFISPRGDSLFLCQAKDRSRRELGVSSRGLRSEFSGGDCPAFRVNAPVSE